MPSARSGKSSGKSADRAAAPTDVLRLENQALEALHETLNANAKPNVDPRREFSRWELRHKRVEVTFHHPGGSVARCLVGPREISAGGAGLLHGGFVYPGAACVLHLRTLSGETRDIPGRIVRCSHVGKHVHSLGIKFDHRIDPREFVRATESSSGFTLERVAPDRLNGRALIIEPDATSRRIIAYYLKDTKLGVEFVDDFAIARETAKQGFDAIIVADGSGPLRADAFLLAIRDSGVMTPAVALCSGDWSRVAAAAAKVGCVVIVGKPFDAATLHRALGEFLLLRAGPALGAGAIVSAFQTDPQMRVLVDVFVKDLERAAEEAAKAIRANDAAACREICLRLKNNGAPHGFKIVSETAAAAIDAIGESASLESAGAELRRLIEVCRRCAPG